MPHSDQAYKRLTSRATSSTRGPTLFYGCCDVIFWYVKSFRPIPQLTLRMDVDTRGLGRPPMLCHLISRIVASLKEGAPVATPSRPLITRSPGVQQRRPPRAPCIRQTVRFTPKNDIRAGSLVSNRRHRGRVLRFGYG